MSIFDQLTGAYADAVLAKDQQALVALYAENVIVFDTWDHWLREGRQATADAVAAWFGGLGEDRVKVVFTPVTSSILGDTAYYGATVRYAAIDAAGAELRAMENRLSWVLRHGAQGWRIVHEHTSTPIDGATLKAKLTRG